MLCALLVKLSLQNTNTWAAECELASNLSVFLLKKQNPTNYNSFYKTVVPKEGWKTLGKRTNWL